MTMAATSASLSFKKLVLNHVNGLLDTVDSDQFVKKGIYWDDRTSDNKPSVNMDMTLNMLMAGKHHP